MSLRSGVVLLVSLSAIAILAACGGSSSGANNTITGTTSTNSELNGSYAFSVTGLDASEGEFFTMTGSIAANGSGGITGGAADYVDIGTEFVGTDLAITGGSYAVGTDGRGTATVAVTSLGSVSFDFVLSSTSHGLITRFDKNGTGSGTLDLQSSVTQSQFAGSYAFSFTGFDDNAGAAISGAGAFTLDSNGNITTGVQDINDAGTMAAGQALSGTVTIGTGSTPGTAQLNTSFGTLAFDVYAVDSTHLKFSETDTATTLKIISGDAFTQLNASLPSGAAVLTIGGLDTSGNPLAAGGLLTFNSDGTISGGSEVLNDSGNVASLSFTGNYSAPAGGRALLSLSGFTPAIQYALYPSSGGVLMEETDGVTLTSGTVLAQTATSISTSGGYGFNLSAENGGGYEVDDIASFTVTSSAITGTIDENDQGSTHPGLSLSGTYAAPTGGLGTMTFTDSIGTYNFDYFVASSSSVLFIETDSTQVGLGSFLGQNGVGSSASVVHAVMARPRAGFHPTLKKDVTGK
jgi:hypothetical protein